MVFYGFHGVRDPIGGDVPVGEWPRRRVVLRSLFAAPAGRLRIAHRFRACRSGALPTVIRRVARGWRWVLPTCVGTLEQRMTQATRSRIPEITAQEQWHTNPADEDGRSLVSSALTGRRLRRSCYGPGGTLISSARRRHLRRQPRGPVPPAPRDERRPQRSRRPVPALAESCGKKPPERWSPLAAKRLVPCASRVPRASV